MSQYHPRTALVLGGIRSGKSEFAEALVEDAPIVRYVATGRSPGPAEDRDDDWAERVAAHRARRPANWTTEEVAEAPENLINLIIEAKPDDTLLVDDIGNWIASMFGTDANEAIKALAAAVESSPARIVIVSPEVGLSVVPSTPAGRMFADANGVANRALAAVCDGVALVVAGQATWLKSDRSGPKLQTSTVAAASAATAVIGVAETAGVEAPTDESPIHVGMMLPQPDASASADALIRAGRVPVPGAGLGSLASLVSFAAGTRSGGAIAPYQQIRVVVVNGACDGEIASGDTDEAWQQRTEAIRSGEGVLSRLAGVAGAGNVAIELVNAGRSNAIEHDDAMDPEALQLSLWQGWQIAQRAADRGDELIVLAAGGPGVDAAAAATVAGITRGEIASLLGRVYVGDGAIDDTAWIRRCLAVRDTLHRIKPRLSDGPHMAAALGGPAIALATGLILGAADRRTPVMIDGPVGAAAALTARDYATEVRLWVLLTDDGGHPAVRASADLLGLTPAFQLGIGLGEGATSLAVLPLIQSSLALAALAALDG